MKSWVSSAFSDSSASTIKATRSKTSFQKIGKNLSEKQTLSNLTNKVKETFNSPNKQKTVNSTSLAIKYEPQTRSELSVHKNKVEQLSNLLDNCLNKNKGSLILIEGPSGCGKYVALKVLCKEKNVQLVEWDQDILNLKSFDLQNESELSTPYESQLKKFTQFLFKSSRYESNQLFSSANSLNSKILLLVKDLPNFAFRDPQVFLNLLQEFNRFSKFSLVFTITTTHSSDFNPYRIFSIENKKNLGISEISFNPIANTYLSKKIDKIAKLERFAFVDKKFLENICATGNGDLRHAINLMELISTGHKVHLTGKKKTDCINFESGSKDSNFSIFRGIGKILHRKNVDSTFEQFKIPSHLAIFKRPHLNTDPEEIYDKLSLSSDQILSYLHQNYIDIFNIKSSSADFDTQFDALIKINENFIYSDIINKTSVLFESGTNTGNQEARLKEISASLTIRSILFNFYFNSENDSKSMWMPLFKPFNSKLMEAKLKKKKMARDFVNLATEKSYLMSRYLIEMNKEIFTEFIPFMQLRCLFRRSGMPKDALTMMLYKPEFTQLFSKCTKVKTNTQQTTENDYENEDLKEDVLDANDTNKKLIVKSTYEYEDTSGLKIEDFNF